MLSINECKKYLRGNLSDEEIQKMIDVLYQMANLLVDKHLQERENKSS